jgi:hypothetical protein
MFLYLKWYIKRRTSGAGLLSEYRDEINRLKADINAVTDRNLLLVEESIKKLKEIQDDTGKRISVYVKELEKSRRGEELYTNLGRGIRAALNTGAVQQDAPALSGVRSSLPVVTQPLEREPAKPLPSIVEPQKPSSKRQIRTYIDLLVNEGIPPEEIASRLEISRAEVDLAMNLRRKK